MLLVRCEYCLGKGKQECPACAASSVNKDGNKGGSTRRVSGDLDVGSGSQGFGDAVRVAGARARSGAEMAGNHIELVSECALCHGKGYITCPGCCGSGYIDMPAWA